MSSRLYVVAVIAGLSVAQARAAEDPAAYLITATGGAPVTSGYGACVRTSQWTPEASYVQCDPQPTVHAVDAVPETKLIRISVDALSKSNSALLRTDAVPALDKLASELAHADYQMVKIVGRADRMGGAKYNQQLSEQRARAVGDYLAAHGVERSKIAVSGVGRAESMTRDQCKGLERKHLIACLQPDRSAGITVIGTQTSAMR